MSDAAPRRVLLVEDEADLRLSLGLSLRMAGLEVEEAATGAEALRRLRALDAPDVVVLDLRLPDISGWEVLDHLRHADALQRLQVVVGSADADPAARRRAEQAGCVGYLVKPFDPDELVALISHV